MPRPTRQPGRLPDYDLKVFNRETTKSTYVGAGWLRDDGGINISIDQCVHLTADPNLVFTLWPVDAAKKGDGRSGSDAPDSARRQFKAREEGDYTARRDRAAKPNDGKPKPEPEEEEEPDFFGDKPGDDGIPF